MTDTERLNWLENEGYGVALINDDNCHWAVVFDGFQNVALGWESEDLQTTFFIGKDKWYDSLRDAIDMAMMGEKE